MPIKRTTAVYLASLLTLGSAHALAEAPPLAVSWIHGRADCSRGQESAYQAFKLNDDTYILRQDKCLEYEAPFLYLLLGRQRALLLDTGSVEIPTDTAETDAQLSPLRQVVDRIMDDYAAAQHIKDLPLLVAHSHGHGDHVAGDPLFHKRARTHVVDPGVRSVLAFWGFSSMTGPGVVFDLGDRLLDVLPIPGHFVDHIAVYDRNHALLMSGDSLYPGRLYIDDWGAFRASIGRLQRVIAVRPLDYILGGHIEMSRQAGVDYPVGSTYQPNEHVLELRASHLDELNQALKAIGPHPKRQTHADFIIDP